MNLSRDEVRAALFAVSACHRGRALAGLPTHPSVLALRRRLELALRLPAVSPSGQETGCGAEQLEAQCTTWIGTAEAAGRLGVTPRTVRRHAADLGGQLIGGRLLYPTRTVDHYREGRHD